MNTMTTIMAVVLAAIAIVSAMGKLKNCLLYTSPSPRDRG